MVQSCVLPTYNNTNCIRILQTKGAIIIPKLHLGKDVPLKMTALSGSPKAEATLVSISGMNKM